MNQSEVLDIFILIYCIIQGELSHSRNISTWRQFRKVLTQDGFFLNVGWYQNQRIGVMCSHHHKIRQHC